MDAIDASGLSSGGSVGPGRSYYCSAPRDSSSHPRFPSSRNQSTFCPTFTQTRGGTNNLNIKISWITYMLSSYCFLRRWTTCLVPPRLRLRCSSVLIQHGTSSSDVFALHDGSSARCRILRRPLKKSCVHLLRIFPLGVIPC
jgi:hypothetical protein